MFLFDIDDYFRKNTPYRTEQILLGIEVGLQPQAIEEDRKMTAAHPFDEVVGPCTAFWGRICTNLPPMRE